MFEAGAQQALEYPNVIIIIYNSTCRRLLVQVNPFDNLKNVTFPNIVRTLLHTDPLLKLFDVRVQLVIDMLCFRC
jgi:hypothetical protein